MEDKKGSVKQKGNFWNHDRKDALKGYLLIFPFHSASGDFYDLPYFLPAGLQPSGWKPFK